MPNQDQVVMILINASLATLVYFGGSVG